MRLRSIFREGWLCTAYEPGPLYEGTEGELYDLAEDPLQWRNLWDEPAYRPRRTKSRHGCCGGSRQPPQELAAEAALRGR